MCRRALGLALLVVVGCIRDDLVRCGDELCPVGVTCTPRGCIPAERITACVDHEENEVCGVADFARGVCMEGICVEEQCGDGEVVGSEVCDDGNQRSGDGCSADCLSAEVCGNGYIDTLAGEQCDDAQLALSGDGCTSRCTLEITNWRNVSPVSPSPRANHVAAYDTVRNRMVVFGGTNISLEDATWECDQPGAWRRFDSKNAPNALTGGAMAFDAGRARTIFFGGLVDGAPIQATYLWDGIRWRRASQLVEPPARSGAAMAYDAANDRVVLFGGTGASGALGDTWLWDGVTWTDVTVTPAPPAGAWSMVWDWVGNSIVLVAAVATEAETWRWDGTTWTNLAISTPQIITSPSSGISSSGAGVLGVAAFGTFELVNDTWVTRSPATSPTLNNFSVVYVPITNQVMLFGGTGALCSPTCYATNQRWLWTSTNWNLGLTNRPPTGAASRMSYDPLRGTTLLTGGHAGTLSITQQQYEWDGKAWGRHPLAPEETARARHILVATLDETLMYGGATEMSEAAAPLGDTWTWNGTVWTRRAESSSPPARADAGASYDSARHVVVMFGGRTASGLLDETWEWDGAAWTQRSPTTVPTQRAGVALTYDAHRQRIVMFGGETPTLLDETWEYDGATWQRVVTPTAPPARRDAVIVYDPVRRRVILFGGRNEFVLDDTWEYDGTTWLKLDVATVPEARYQHTATFDAIRRDVLVYGGLGPSVGNSVWALQTSSASFGRETCTDIDIDGDGLAGCSDPDCWGRCTPSCVVGTSCSDVGPSCGDGSCGAVEDYLVCPADCP